MIPDRASPSPVTILLAVYNGAAHLPRQLQSLGAQTHTQWHVVASDDGSQDESADVLEQFGATHSVRRVQGPGQGFAQNFLSMIAALPEQPGYVALCDQDDVWLPDKLTQALAQLAAVPDDQPALYCGRRFVWEPEANRRSLSRDYPRAPSFANALIENIAAGNTIVLNPAAAVLAREAAPKTGSIFAHDWWLYLLISGGRGCGDLRPRTAGIVPSAFRQPDRSG